MDKKTKKDDDSIENAEHAIQYNNGVHVVMEYASQLNNNNRLSVFLQEKLPTLIRLFIIATLKKKHSPEEFYKDFNAMTTIFAVLFPQASSGSISHKVLNYIKTSLPNLVQDFLRQFNYERYSNDFKFESIYLICRDIYFAHAPLTDRLNLASFLIGVVKENFEFSKQQDYISVKDLEYMKKLFLLSKSVLCDLLPDENNNNYSSKKKKREDDDEDKSVKKPKTIKKYQLQKSVDPSEKWILMIDKAAGKETLIEEDDNQRQISVYCAHVHERGVLKKYLGSFDKKNNQKLCPVCDSISRTNKNVFYSYFSSSTFFLGSSGANGLNPL